MDRVQAELRELRAEVTHYEAQRGDFVHRRDRGDDVAEAVIAEIDQRLARVGRRLVVAKIKALWLTEELREAGITDV